MLNLGQLAATVQKNCDISDAQYAGDYTLCIFLLKMREFYRWEHQMAFTDVLPREAVGRWMQERERMWEEIEANPFESLPLDTQSADPFDARRVNSALLERGYVYSAGYGRFGKPHFFLGALQRREQREDVTILVSSCEYARDLVAPPAMLLDNVIYLRQESLRRYLWERVEEWRWNHKNEAMARAVDACHFDHDANRALDQLTETESESVILHELGEARVEKLFGERWAQMLTGLSRSKAEIMVRAVRDILADCLSTLPVLIESERDAALHFYFAGFSGMRRHLFPEAMLAYQDWLQGNRRALARMVRDGTTRWLDTSREILALHTLHGDAAGPRIEALLEHPPGCQILTAH